MNRTRVIALFLIAIVSLAVCSAVFAQEEAVAGADQTAAARTPLETGLLALSAAVAIAGTAIGTGMAQSRIGAAGAGTIAERPESTGSIIILLAIPETMVILGFIVAVIVLFAL